MEQIFTLDFLLYSRDFLITHQAIYLLFIAVISLCIGSFLNVVVYRLPKMLHASWEEESRNYLKLPLTSAKKKRFSLFLPFSHCPNCQKTLMPWHNIPVISFIFLRGKCAYCNIKIAARYPIVELLTSIISLYLAQRFGVTLQVVAALIFSWILISASLIDYDHYLIPDELSLLLMWVGLLFSMSNIFCNSHDAIIGAVSGYLIFHAIAAIFTAITGKIGLGQGDFKLLAGLGAYLGWQQLLNILFLSSIIGLVCTVVHRIMNRKNKVNPYIPFGPYLALGGWICLIWGKQMTQQLYSML